MYEERAGFTEQGQQNSHHTYHKPSYAGMPPPPDNAGAAANELTEDEKLKRIQELEEEVRQLKAREKKLKDDIAVFQKIFNYLQSQFKNIKKKYK
jgi:predicted RNase H-like nuclease (RuvC/YqgF family)